MGVFLEFITIGSRMLALQIFLLAGHLLNMNLAAVGPLAAVILQWFSTGRDEVRQLGQKIAAWSLVCMLTGMILGLSSGIIMWVAGADRFFQALHRVPSKIYFGVWELGFYVLCMAIYLIWWRLRPPQGKFAHVILSLVGIAAATNLLWHFPALMTVIAYLARHEPTGPAIDASGFRALMFTEQIMSRWLHVWMASFATTGLVVSYAALGMRASLAKDTGDEMSGSLLDRICAWGGRVALVATLLQLPIGIWLLISSPISEQTRLLGGDWLATGMFFVSVILALGLLHQLAGIAMGNGTRRGVLFAWLLLLVIIIFMSATLVLARGNAFGRETSSRDHVVPLAEFAVTTGMAATDLPFPRRSHLKAASI